MKRFAVLIIILLVGGFTSQSIAQKKGRAVVCFKSNMDCIDCETTLYEHLKFEKGVKDLKVDHASNTIYIEFLEKKNDEKGLVGAIEKKGYTAAKIDRKTYDKALSDVNAPGNEQQHEVPKECE